MKVKLLRKVLYVVCFSGVLAACNDDNYDGPSPYDVNATYTNQLSAGNKANLALLYNEEALIGKNVYFKLKDAHTGYLSLKQILPGEQETNLDNIPLTTDGESYSFNGSATTANGTSFAYTGKVETGKLALSLSNIALQDNLLKGKRLNTVEYKDPVYGYGKVRTTTYSSSIMLRLLPRTQLDFMSSMMVSLVGPLATQIAGKALKIVLNKVEFRPDGNIIADYADWPEGYDIMGDTPAPKREDDDYTPSPANLATYYFTNSETLFVIPNIDQIIYTVQQNATKQGRSLSDPQLQEIIQKLYMQLATWARYGIRFKATENPYTGEGQAPVYKFDSEGNRIVDPSQAEKYTGDYLLQIDTDQLAIVGVLLEAMPYLAPELCATPLTDIEALADYAGLIQMVFPEADTVGKLLVALKAFGDNLDFEIGLLLNNPSN